MSAVGEAVRFLEADACVLAGVRRSAFESRVASLARLAERVPLFLAGEGALALPSPPAGVTVLPRDLRVAAAIVDAVGASTVAARGRPQRARGRLTRHTVGRCGSPTSDTPASSSRWPTPGCSSTPGTFADDLSDVRDLSAVLVTHQHPDHLDPERLPALVAANPDAVVLCDPGSLDVLAGLGVEARAHDGAATTVGAVTVTPFGRAARPHPRRHPAHHQRRGAPRRRGRAVVLPPRRRPRRRAR